MSETETTVEISMQVSFEDARFFYNKMDGIVRRSEQEIEAGKDDIRRYFRAFLHCWKSISQYACEAHMSGKKFGKWVEEKWLKGKSDEIQTWHDLSSTRDKDLHLAGVLSIDKEIGAAVPTPIVFFTPRGNDVGPRRQLLECCRQGLDLAERFIRERQWVS